MPTQVLPAGVSNTGLGVGGEHPGVPLGAQAKSPSAR